MIYIACFIFVFALLQMSVALINLSMSPSMNVPIQDSNEIVSVMIPARNEENNILNILSDLQHQTYNNIEIIIFDDQSTDRTPILVSNMAEYDNRIQLVESTSLPENWLGKNYACHAMSQQAKGKYFLFVDADVRLDEYAISNTLHYFKQKKLNLLSIFPKQLMFSAGEKSVVPLMNYILLTLLPLFLVRSSKHPSLSAANGQFMMFDAAVYRKVSPHKLMRVEKVEDIKIVRYFKKIGHSTACLVAKNQISCRMYNSYNESLNGFSKNVIMFFGNSYIIATLFWLVTTLGFIIVLFQLPLIYFWLLNLIVILTRIFVSKVSGQRIIENILFIIPQQINLFLLILKSKRNAINGNYEWKGRKIK